MKKVTILLTNEVIKNDKGVIIPLAIANLMCVTKDGKTVSKQIYTGGKNSSVACLKALNEALKTIKGECTIEVLTNIPYITKVINKIDIWSSKGFKLNDGSMASNLALLLTFISQKNKQQIQGRISVKQYKDESIMFIPYKRILKEKLNIA